MSFYVGHGMSAQECYWLSPVGMPCSHKTIIESPIPLCRAHAIALDAQLRVAILAARPAPPAKRVPCGCDYGGTRLPRPHYADQCLPASKP